VLGSREPDLKLSRDAIARIARGSDVSVVGAEAGAATSLNARRAVAEARYMARVANRSDPYWEREALRNADAIRPFLDRPRVTVVTFQLDRNGHVSGLHVSESSGIEAIDRVALTTIRMSAPYDPLPPELAARGVTVQHTFRWEPRGLLGSTVPGAAP
ncbi:MAG TPA: TonB family protein, partial [Anaeromyxobacteraceae bacterium]|nr:TonB family protein [Anaeromyxobacteraceae bacterium]